MADCPPSIDLAPKVCKNFIKPVAPTVFSVFDKKTVIEAKGQFKVSFSFSGVIQISE